MLRIADNQIGTGGQRMRDLAQLRNMPGVWCLYGEVGSLSHVFDAGGPLDAPDYMPAGGMNCTEWRCGSGAPLAAQWEAART